MGDGELREAFSRRLRAFLDSEGVTDAELARRMGLRQSVVHAWTSGRSLPMPYRLRDLCIATGVSADWWLCLGERR